jgi:hypothetical protein
LKHRNASSLYNNESLYQRFIVGLSQHCSDMSGTASK